MSGPAGEKVVRAGVAVFLHNDAGEYLVMRRKGSHGAGTWGLPGGHIEFGEDADVAAIREVREETGAEVGVMTRLGWSEAYFEEEGKHYITALLSAKLMPGSTVEIMEPGKCDELRWVRAGAEPEPLFPPLRNYLLRSGAPGLASDAVAAARDRLGWAVPHIRYMVKKAEAVGRADMGVLAVQEGDEGEVVARFSASEFVDDLAAALGVPPQSTEDDIDGAALDIVSSFDLRDGGKK